MRTPVTCLGLFIITLFLLCIPQAPGQDGSGFKRSPGKSEENGPPKAYTKRLKKADPKTAADHYALALWCEKKGFAAQAREHLLKTIELDPDHEAARKALGFKRVAGEWQAEDQWRAAAGHVKIEGRWHTPAEVRKSLSALTSRLLSKAVDWISKNDIKSGYQPVGHVVSQSLCGLALLGSGAKPGSGGAGRKLAELIQQVQDTILKIGQQNSWSYGFGGIFLCEAYAAKPNPELKDVIEKACAQITGAIMLEDGGFTHGQGRPLLYRHLGIVQPYLVSVCAMARKLEIPVDEGAYAKMVAHFEGLKNRNGSMAYSKTNRSTLVSNTCAGVFGAKVAGLEALHEAFMVSAGPRLDQSIKNAHSWFALRYWNTAFGAAAMGEHEFMEWSARFVKDIASYQREDGSIYTEGQRSEKRYMQPAGATGAYAAVLAIARGNYRFIGGAFNSTGSSGSDRPRKGGFGRKSRK